MTDTHKPNDKADGSTDISEDEKARTEALPDGSGSDASDGDAEQDTASGGAPADPE